MYVDVSHTQSIWRPASRALTKLIRWLSDIHPARRPIDRLSIITTDHREMTEQNQCLLGHRGSTDVISCLYEPLQHRDECLGDIIINVELALNWRANGNRFPKGWNAERELALYLFHGWDHLCGANDNTPTRRRAMRRRELGWVREAVRKGLLKDLKSKISKQSPSRSRS